MASPLFALSPSALMLLLLLLVDADIGVAGATRVSPNKKVAVQVLYESLCPDSIRFIKDQLAPTFEALGSQRMVVEFVPYGKATTMRTDSGFDFRCQHGHSECRGNKLQACALARLLADNKRQVKFVTCVMSLTNPSRPSEKCIGEAGLQMEDLRTCVSGREGEVLLAGMGEKTPSDISFVPQVLLNGEAEDQDQMLSNLMHMVCDHLAPTDRPSACER